MHINNFMVRSKIAENYYPPFRDFCYLPANNFNITKRFSSTSFSSFTKLQIVFFLLLEFQPPQLPWIWFIFLLIRFGFLELSFCNVLLWHHFLFYSCKLSSLFQQQQFFFVKIDCSTGFRHIELQLAIGKCAYK